MMTSNAAQVSKQFDAAVKNLGRATVKSHRGASWQGMRFARKIAPKKSGALKAGITRKLYKKSSAVVSTVPKSFPYNLWVNMNIKSVLLAGKQRTYPSTRHTGSPRFFSLMVELLTQKYPKMAKVNIDKALRASFKG